MRITELESERLVMRQWRASDLAPFAALNADSEVMAHFPATLSRAQSDAMAMRCQARIARCGFGFWIVETRGTRDVIGVVGLNEAAAELPCAPCVEVGWRLAKPFWGQGYATEAAHAALNAGFEHLGLDEVLSFTALPNHRSRAVMKRLGMHYVDTFEHPELPAGHVLRTHCLYRAQNPRTYH